MSVVDVTKMWSKTGGSLSSALLSSLTQVWAVTEGYSVVHDPATAIDDIVGHVDLPIVGQQHRTIGNAFVKSKSPETISPIMTVVVVNYEGIVSDEGVEVEWSDVSSTEPIDRDWDGTAITTVNGEPIDGLTVEIADQVVVIRRKFMTINTAGIAAYRRATNSDIFLGWPVGTARLVGFSATNKFQYSGLRELWSVTARIQFRQPYANTTNAQAWYQRWRHEGLYVKDGDFIRRAVDHLGQETSKPVLLKADGTQETDPEAAVYNHTQAYDSLPYAALGLV